jgi:hypothetical protein
MITNWRQNTQQWSSLVNPHHGLCYGLDYCEGWILFHIYGVAACVLQASKMVTYYQPTQRGCLWPKHSTLYKGCTLKQLDVRRRGGGCFVAGVQPPTNSLHQIRGNPWYCGDQQWDEFLSLIRYDKGWHFLASLLPTNINGKKSKLTNNEACRRDGNPASFSCKSACFVTEEG